MDLPNGSSEAAFLTGGRNSGCGMIPILEYLKDRQTIVDKSGSNGLFLASHDTTMKAMMYKTTESVPEICNNAIFWQIYISLEDSLDWFHVAGHNGTIRRLCYAYADSTGVGDIPIRSCSHLNSELGQRLQTMFQVFRTASPKFLKFVFSREEAENKDAVEHEQKENFVMPKVSDEELGTLFDGSGRGDRHNYGSKLKLMRQRAKQIAEETMSDADTSVEQLSKNLRSIIGQKAAEMNLLFSLVTRNSQAIAAYYEDVFEAHSGYVELSNRDIEEAAVAVRRSREIFLSFMDAHQFEETFIKQKSKIPKTFFMKRNLHLTQKTQAMIFAIRYIKGRKSEAKSLKQSLKKNCTDIGAVSMKYFVTPLPPPCFLIM